MYDIVIIGGGPAGLTAALYASRRSLKTLVLTRDIGGQASKTLDIENYPGVVHAKGVDLTATFKKQAESFGAKINFEETKEINPGKNEFEIKTINNSYKSKTVILAFGKKPQELDAKGEEEFKGKGVSYCATCDAPFFRNKTVTIVGGGNSALDAALLSSTISKKVYLVHRRDQFRAEEVLIDKANKAKNIEIIYNAQVKEVKGKDVVESIILDTGKEIKTDGVIVEVGYIVDNSLVEKLVKLNEKNQVIIDNYQMTSVPGIFAAGDVTITPFKQIVISAGEGAKAALGAYNYIQNIKDEKGTLNRK